MTIPQIEELIANFEVEFNRLNESISDLTMNLHELRQQLGVERPELQATPATRSEPEPEPEPLMPYPTPRRGR